MENQPTKAEGYRFNPTTRNWDIRVEFQAPNRMEAIRWMNFSRDWFKDLRIIEETLGEKVAIPSPPKFPEW